MFCLKEIIVASLGDMGVGVVAETAEVAFRSNGETIVQNQLANRSIISESAGLLK